MIASTTRRASVLDGRRQPKSSAKRYWRKCDDAPTLIPTRVAVHVSLTNVRLAKSSPKMFILSIVLSSLSVTILGRSGSGINQQEGHPIHQITGFKVIEKSMFITPNKLSNLPARSRSCPHNPANRQTQNGDGFSDKCHPSSRDPHGRWARY